MHINTLMIERILAEPNWSGQLTTADLRGLMALVFTHIHPYGTFRLDMNTRLPIEPRRQGGVYGRMWLYDGASGSELRHAFARGVLKLFRLRIRNFPAE